MKLFGRTFGASASADRASDSWAQLPDEHGQLAQARNMLLGVEREMISPAGLSSAEWDELRSLRQRAGEELAPKVDSALAVLESGMQRLGGCDSGLVDEVRDLYDRFSAIVEEGRDRAAEDVDHER